MLSDFQSAMYESGITYKGHIISDGKIHRFFSTGGKKSNKDAWYVSHGMAGAFGCWRRGINEKWSTKGHGLSLKQQEELRRQIEISNKTSYEERRRKNEEASTEALKEWQTFSESGKSDYLDRKKVSPIGIRFREGGIAIPMRDINGKLWSYQKIYDDGTKRSFPGGRKYACFHHLGVLKNGDPIYVVEGYATGASVYMASQIATVIAFDSGNLDPIIAELKKKYPKSEITICGDDDRWREDSHNAGKQTAEAARKKYGCHSIFPIFKNTDSKPTDFYDLHVLEGLSEVERQLFHWERSKVAKVAIVSEALSDKDFEVATFIAILSKTELQRLQTECFLKEDKFFNTKAIFVRDMTEEAKGVLRSLYPHHAILRLPNNPEALETIPSYVKEVVILSGRVDDQDLKKDRYRKRLLQRQTMAVSIAYLPDDLNMGDFINPSNEANLKLFINQAHSDLEISSCLMEMTNASSLFKYNTKETSFLIDSLLPSIGVSFLAGNPKSGKSWMALNFIKAILRGEPVFGGFFTKNVKVYYLSLEDNASRLKTRMQMVFGEDNPCVEGLLLKTHSEQLNDEMLEELKKELEADPAIKFLIIDPFQKVRPNPERNFDAYQKDYKDLSHLKRLAEELELSILLIHHFSKGTESLNGSMGLSGSADSILSLKKEDQGVSLKITGKDVEDRTLALTYDPENWIFSIDEREKIETQGLRGEIIRILESECRSFQPKEIACLVGKGDAAGSSSVRNQLKILKDKGLIESPKRGFYQNPVATFATQHPEVAIKVADSNPCGQRVSWPVATFETQTSPPHKPGGAPPKMVEVII